MSHRINQILICVVESRSCEKLYLHSIWWKHKLHSSILIARVRRFDDIQQQKCLSTILCYIISVGHWYHCTTIILFRHYYVFTYYEANDLLLNQNELKHLHNFESNSDHDVSIKTDILQIFKEKYLYLNEYSE